MKNMKSIVGLIIAVLILIILSQGLYVVKETEQVIITRFGEYVKTVTDAGLHFKTPFIQQVNSFEKRWLEWDGAATQIPTREKKFITVDTYARWRIADPLLFFQRLKDELGAQTRLDDILEGEARNAVPKYYLIEIVRSTNRDFLEISGKGVDDTKQMDQSEFKIEIGREKISAEILENASKAFSEFGIEVVDFQIKRINYIEEVRKSVYERMISERKKIAERYRSEGQGLSEEILGQKDRELLIIQSEAEKQAEEIRGEGDAEATNIYAKAYQRDPEFYAFWQTLETLKRTLDNETWLLLSTDSDFLRYLKDIQ
jgi:membrane protease subunit HflC